MIRVGVLRGGTGHHYNESLDTGAYVLQHLPRTLYEPIDIFIDREGVWHLAGLPVSHEKLQHRVDVIWNALHGHYGADGKVQQVLESLGIPYTGSDVFSSAITHNHRLLGERLSQLNIKTPRGIYVEDWGGQTSMESIAQVASHVAQKLSPPWIVKPISFGHANGAMKCKTRDELSAVLRQMSEHAIPIVIEEAVMGREVCVICTPQFRGKPGYTFLPIEKSKLEQRMPKNESEALQKLARDIHAHLGLGQYSELRAIIHPKTGIHVVEVQTQPQMHADSHLEQALSAVGSSFAEFAQHVIEKAKGR
jgi:D-alanine-D-alanine ligase